jgi:hypothetical protein
VIALLRRLLKPTAADAGVGYALRHHVEIGGAAALLHLALLAAGRGPGRWLAPRAAADPLRRWGLGFGATSLLVLGWGLTGLLFRWPVLGGTALAAAAALATPSRPGRGTRRDVPRSWWPRAPVARALALSCGAALAATVAVALHPDTSWDAVVYHLRVPAWFVAEHRVFHVPTHQFTAFPLATEMLTAWLMLTGDLDLTGGGGSARLFHLSCAVVAAAAARRMAARVAAAPHGGERSDRAQCAGWAAAAVVLLSPLTGTIGVRAYNDFVQAAFGGLAGDLLLAGGPGSVPLAGALLGIALSAKFTAAIPLAALAALWFRRRPAPYVAAAAAFLPWAAKAWLLTGNPSSPFLGRLFPPAGPETAFQLDAYAASVTGSTFSPRLALEGLARLVRGGEGERLTELAGIGLAAAILIGARPAAGARRLGALAAALVLGWALLTPDQRFATPVLAPLAAVAGGGLARLLAWRPAAAALAVLLPLNLVRLPLEHVRLFDPLPFAVGRETAWAHATRSLFPAPSYGTLARWANASLPPGARLLVMVDIKAHYIWRRTYHDFQYVRPGLFLRWLRGAGGSPEALRRKLRQEGISHILVVRQRTRDVGNHYAWEGGELAAAAEFLAAWTRPLVTAGESSVLAVLPRPERRRPLDGYEWMLLTHPENLFIWNRDAEAIALLEVTARRAPWLKGVQGLLGMALARQARYPGAEAALRAAVREAGPQSARASFVFGQVRALRHDPAGALAAWREAIRLDPRYAEPRYHVGAALWDRGDRREAFAQMAEAARLEPENAEYAAARAKFAAALGAP